MNDVNDIGLYFKIISKEIKGIIDSKLKNNVTSVQMSILCFLDSKGSSLVYQKDIENLFHVRRSTITEIINVMEKNDLLRRVFDPCDKRKRVIVLTETGLGYVNEFKDVIKDVESNIYDGITDSEKEMLIFVFEKMSKNIKRLQEEI